MRRRDQDIVPAFSPEPEPDPLPALREQLADLHTQLVHYRKAAWLLAAMEQAARERHLVLEWRDGLLWLSVNGQLFKGPSLLDAGLLAFEQPAPDADAEDAWLRSS